MLEHLDHYSSGMNRIVNVTVSKNQTVDYYTCNNKGYWLTNIIYWGETICYLVGN